MARTVTFYSASPDIIQIESEIDRHVVNIHEPLLARRSPKIDDKVMDAWDRLSAENPERERTQRTLRIRLPLGRLALDMWSRWIYGHPMRQARDVNEEEQSEEAEALGQIYLFCIDSETDKAQDVLCANACLEGIRELLTAPDEHGDSPLLGLFNYVPANTKGWSMILNLLVHEKCLADGNTLDWLKEAKHHEDWLRALVFMFAMKGAGTATYNAGHGLVLFYNADPLEPCAFHESRAEGQPCCTPAPTRTLG